MNRNPWWLPALVMLGGCVGEPGASGARGVPGVPGVDGEQGQDGQNADPSAVWLEPVRYDETTSTARLAWTFSVDGNFRHYEIHRGADPDSTSSELLGTVDDRYATEWVLDFDTRPTTNPTFSVVTVNEAGKSTQSNTQQLTGIHAFVRTFGSTGTGPGELDYPSSIGFGQDGTVVVGEILGARAQRFSPDGTFLNQVSAVGVRTPYYDVEVGPDGWVYLPDPFGGMEVADLDGQPIRRFPSERPAVSLTFTPNGHRFVLDQQTATVSWFDIDDTLLGSFGTEAEVGDALKVASSRDGERLYVLAVATGHVEVYTPQGDYLYAFGGNAGAPMDCNSCVDVTVDPQGHVVLADLSGRLIVYTARGAWLQELDLDGVEPLGVAFAPDGSLYVADGPNDEIVVYTP